MRKTNRRIIALALTLILMLGVTAPAFAASQYEEEQPFKYYFMIGDSIAIKNNSQMPNIAGTCGFRQDYYSELVAEHFNIPAGYNGAHTGWRPQEVRASIQADYNGDVYTSDWEHRWGGDTLAQIKAKQPQYSANLAKADLITINLGSNTIIGTLAYSLARVFEDQTEGTRWEKAAFAALDKAKEEAPSEAIGTILNAAKLIGQAGVLLRVGLADLNKALKEFPAEWDALIEAIRDVNPDAKIVVLGVYNPVESVIEKKVSADLAKILGEPLGNLTRGNVDVINRYMRSGSAYSADYAFVDIFDVDMTGSDDGSHLGRAGHKMVADRIIAAIESNYICKHEHTERVNAKAATKLSLGKTGDLVCCDCGKLLEKSTVYAYHCQHENTKVVGAITPIKNSGSIFCADCGKLLELGHIIKYAK